MSTFHKGLAAALLVVSAFGCAASAEEEDDSANAEGAASAVDPRTRDYAFELEMSKLPTANAGNNIQIRVKTQGRFWRTVSESCIQLDPKSDAYAALASATGGIAGIIDTQNRGATVSHALLGDIYGLELSVEEGKFDVQSLQTHCASITTVRHKLKVKFDEDRDAKKTSDWTHLSFGSHVKYEFGVDKLTFAPKTLTLVNDAGTDSGTSTDAGSADASADSSIDSGSTQKSTSTPQSEPPAEEHESPAASDDDPDPSSVSDDPPVAKKKSADGGCNVGGNTTSNAATFGIAIGLALLAQRRKRSA